jgi:hypothetical protein
MCYDIVASKRASIIGLASSFLLYNFTNTNEFKGLALFFAFVTLMQVYDWIFWLNQEKNAINYLFTKIAMISNHLQPIMLACIIVFYIGKNLDNESLTALCAYGIVALIYSIYIFDKIDYTLVTEKSSPSLYWQWNNFKHSSVVYAFFLLALSIISYNSFSFPLNYIMTFINIATFFFSMYTYKNSIIGRMWCHYASYVPVCLLFLSKWG